MQLMKNKRAGSTLTKNVLHEPDCFSIYIAIEDAVLSKTNWNFRVDKVFLSTIAPVQTKITGAEKGCHSELEIVRAAAIVFVVANPQN